MNQFPMTLTGAEALKAELKTLKTVERPRITNDIAVAREHGDLKENAEYHAAREQQGMVEARIRHLEGVISHMQVIDVVNMPNTGKIIFGTTVTLLNVETEAETTYQIVGQEEASVEAGKISVTSPMARALIGKMDGDEVRVETPAGITEYEITQVQYI